MNKKRILALPLHLFFVSLLLTFFVTLILRVTPVQTFPLEANSASGSGIFTPDHLSLIPTQASSKTVLSSLTYLGGQLKVETEPATPAAALLDAEYCIEVPVIMYHHIQPLEMAKKLGHETLTVDSEIFDEQMHYLVNHGYTALAAEELINALIGYQQLPEKSIVITIDDGYDDNYTYGFLAAKKYQLIMNFMIPSALTGKPGYMTWDHLQEMQQSPYARIYNHTATHAPIGLLKQPEIEAELASSSAEFTSRLGLENTVFTYPYGSSSPLAIEMVKKHGFTGAFSTVHGRRQCRSEIMHLKRDHIGNAPLTLYSL